MDHYKISKLLNSSTVWKFVTKKWDEINALTSDRYSVNKNIRFKTWMLSSDWCDYSDVYIFVYVFCLDHAFPKLTVHW